VIFAAVATVLFFALLEGALLLAGIRPALVDDDPYVGFASHVPLFVPRQRADGAVEMVTADNKLPWFNPQRFLRDKPAGTFRIFCLGGSTTYGRPYRDPTSFCGWLRELLPAAAPRRQWELINAGGISYASYRVARLMEELAAHEPDLFVIYCGHNEFLEDRTYGRLRRTPAFVQRLVLLLSRTRTYASLRRILRPAADTSQPVNVRDRPLLPAEVKTRLDQGVGPDAFRRDDPLQRQVLAHFQWNLRRMVEVARGAGARVLLVTPASNLRHCAPFKTERRQDLAIADEMQLARLLAAADDARARNDDQSALAAADAILAIDDRYAAAHFLRGRCLDALEGYDEARAAYVRAREEDVCPLRALTEIERAVLQVAREHGVPCVDFVNLVRQASPQQIPGEDLFLDHVHPTIAGHRMLALAIVETMIERGWVEPAPQWGPEAIAQVTARVEGRVDRQAHADALRNLAKVFAWAGKEEEADRMALRAGELAAPDANTLFLTGNALISQGDLDAAIDKLQEAVARSPRFVPAISSLGVAHQKRGELDEAARQYRRALEIDDANAAAHNNLAALYLAQSRWQAAMPHLRRAIEINPRYAKAHHNLGVACAKQKLWDQAIDSLERAVSIDPELAAAHRDLGGLQEALGADEQAVLHYRRALQLAPESLPTANNLAWLLATSRESSLRDGQEALRWAKRCAVATGYRQAGVLNTLAAAYAEAGNFAQAVRWQEQALQLAPEAMKEGCRDRLAQFRDGQPVRGSRR
jgi:tetratricopeptide (TPR) repeat protein